MTVSLMDHWAFLSQNQSSTLLFDILFFSECKVSECSEVCCYMFYIMDIVGPGRYLEVMASSLDFPVSLEHQALGAPEQRPGHA